MFITKFIPKYMARQRGLTWGLKIQPCIYTIFLGFTKFTNNVLYI